MEEQKTIKWGFFDGHPKSIRSKEHQEYLIKEYNKDKPLNEQVDNIAELLLAIKQEKED